LELLVRDAVGRPACLHPCLQPEGWLRAGTCCCKLNAGVQAVPTAQQHSGWGRPPQAFLTSLGFVSKALVSISSSHADMASRKVVVFQASKKKMPFSCLQRHWSA